MKENAQFAKLLELMWNSHTALPLHGCLISQSQLPQMYCSFCTLAGFPTQVFMHMQDNTKTCASNTFPKFSFIITRKLLIKHCFGIWKTHLDSLMSTLSSFFPFWNSYMAFPSAMYGSSFGDKKKPCDMKQTCVGLSTLGRNYIYILLLLICVLGVVWWGSAASHPPRTLRITYSFSLSYLLHAHSHKLSLGPKPHSFHHSLLIKLCGKIFIHALSLLHLYVLMRLSFIYIMTNVKALSFEVDYTGCSMWFLLVYLVHKFKKKAQSAAKFFIIF